MSTRKHLRADSSSLELLSALYHAETPFLEVVAPDLTTEKSREKYNQLKRIRRLVSHHLRQQGARADEDDQRDRPE